MFVVKKSDYLRRYRFGVFRPAAVGWAYQYIGFVDKQLGFAFGERNTHSWQPQLLEKSVGVFSCGGKINDKH